MKTVSMRMAMALALAGLCWGSAALAGSKMDVQGISVSISNGGNAYYDDGDYTLTIEPWWDAAKIKVSVGKHAGWWEGYSDVYIYANGLIVASIQAKANIQTMVYLVGQTYYCDQLKTAVTVVGNTDSYGLDVGLGMTSWDVEGWPYPKAISIKSGFATANVLSLDLLGESKRGKIPAEGVQMLLGE